MSKCALGEPVESVGNAWIICRSRSYFNRPYYFNTLTGQAVWNLSKAEIVKARRAEKNFVKTTFSSENCPEPEGPPEHNFANTMKPNHNRIMRPRVYNKQVINNRFTRTSNYSPMNAMPMGVAVPTLYNPLIWNVPTQPVVLGTFNPDLPGTFKPDYSTVSNFNPQLSVSETSISLSKRFSSYADIQNEQSTSYLNMETMRHVTKQLSAETTMDSVSRNNANIDLREKLSAKRRSSTNFESPQNNIKETYEHPTYPNEEILLNMKDEEWLAKNLQKNPYSIDTLSLKKLLNLEDEGFWYIVTDTIVLLNNTNFLRVLLNDDKQCNLIVPQALLEEIESMSKSNINPQAKQVLAFISQQIILHQAIIDGETISNNALYVQDEILGCCSRISEQGFPLVLITNNVEILHLKETVTYQILTMREFKTQTCRSTESVKKYIPLNDIEANIKITIPNELKHASSNQTKYMLPEAELEKTTIQPEEPEEPETSEETDNLPEPCVRKDQPHDNDNYTPPTTKTITTPVNDSYNTPRRLKLNRQTSQDSSKSTVSSTKSFKWRRKSNTNDTLNEFNKLENKKTKEIASEPSALKLGSDANRDNIDTKINNDKYNRVADSCQVSNDKAGDNDVIFIKTEPLSPKRNVSQSKEDKNVMFEITSHGMEENLKLKCDEWVSRFIQIMEEVLTQVLNREPKFVCDAMPPPWTLYEATECTRKKFNNDNDIVDAANKLRNILFDIGGSRGKVKLNISPSQYMEMYSYGVYLTDALQSAISDCEDLQIAAESLYKLLSDIQDTNADINIQDSFGNITSEETEKKGEQGCENIVNNDQNDAAQSSVKVFQLKDIPNIIIRKKTQQNTINASEKSPAKSRISVVSNEFISPSKYFLRSSRKSTPQPEKRICSSKWDFLNQLDLTRASALEELEPSLNQEMRGYENNASSVGNEEPRQDIQRPNTESPFLDSQKPAAAADDNQALLDNCANNQTPPADNRGLCEDNWENISFSDTAFPAQNSQNNNTPHSNNAPEEEVMHPKIVRKFVRCLDFEEKLKSNSNFAQNLDMSFDQDYDFKSGDGYNFDDYEYDDSQNDDYGYEFGDDYGYDEEDKQFFEEEVNDMNCLIQEVVTRIKSSFTVVKDFCEKCYEMLSSSTGFDKSDKLQEAEKASKTLDDICDTLESILKRESSASNNSIKKVSITPELNCIEMSDEEVEKYREVISKSLEQGKLLKEAITMTISSIKSKT